jgi:hypothetical protein
MRRELGDGDADVGELALDLVAIGRALGRLIEIEEALVPSRNLNALIAVALRPSGDALERVVRGRILRELGEEQPWTLESLDRRLPILREGRRLKPTRADRFGKLAQIFRLSNMEFPFYVGSGRSS